MARARYSGTGTADGTFEGVDGHVERLVRAPIGMEQDEPVGLVGVDALSFGPATQAGAVLGGCPRRGQQLIEQGASSFRVGGGELDLVGKEALEGGRRAVVHAPEESVGERQEMIVRDVWLA